MRESRLHVLLCAPRTIKSVQPKLSIDDVDVVFSPKSSRVAIGEVVSRERGELVTDVELDADGNLIPEYD